MPLDQHRTIADIAEAIAHADGECVFLIGAGCSKSAGIPMANQLISEIENKFPNAYERAKKKGDLGYNNVMAQLTTAQRNKLLDNHIDKANVNFAYLALAQLFHQRKIDRILTVNFDPLIMRACAMVGEFPAVYDLATASEFKGSRIAPRSVFYLNGQHTGFTMLNSNAELERHKKRLQQIVDNTGFKRIWVVVGYSGNADPLLEILNDTPAFDNGLYWVSTRDSPPEQMRAMLEDRDKQAYFIGGQDADKFLTELAQNLDCFPPALLARPFEHIEKIITHINFESGGTAGKKVRDALLQKIHRTRKLEEAPDSVDLMAMMLAGKEQEVMAHYQKVARQNRHENDSAAWMHITMGFDLAEDAREIEEHDLKGAQDKWIKAIENYDAALRLNPNMHESLAQWRIALLAEAKSRFDLVEHTTA